MNVLKGLFIIYRLDRSYRDDFLARLKERRITDRFLLRAMLEKREKYGVITRNFAKFMKSFLMPYSSYTASSYSVSVASDTVIATNGTQYTIGLIGLATHGRGSFVYNLAYEYTSNQRTKSIGSVFSVGSGTRTPTPDDYSLENPVQDVAATDVSLIYDADKTRIVVSGGDTASTDFTASEVGLITKILRHEPGVVIADQDVISVLIDRATFDPISFASGDPIACQYVLGLA